MGISDSELISIIFTLRKFKLRLNQRFPVASDNIDSALFALDKNYFSKDQHVQDYQSTYFKPGSWIQ